MRSCTLYNTILPLVSPTAIMVPSGENARTEMGAALASRAPISLKSDPVQVYRYVLLFSAPTATVEPLAATALGVYLGLSSATFWFERKASTTSTSETNTVPSSATAIDLG